MDRNLRSDELTVGRHIYYCDNTKGAKRRFKEGIVLNRYKTYAVVKTRSTFMGSMHSYNTCLNYTDIDSQNAYCIVKDHIEEDEYETQEDITAELN